MITYLILVISYYYKISITPIIIASDKYKSKHPGSLGVRYC